MSAIAVGSCMTRLPNGSSADTKLSRSASKRADAPGVNGRRFTVNTSSPQQKTSTRNLPLPFDGSARRHEPQIPDAAHVKPRALGPVRAHEAQRADDLYVGRRGHSNRPRI